MKDDIHSVSNVASVYAYTNKHRFSVAFRKLISSLIPSIYRCAAMREFSINVALVDLVYCAAVHVHPDAIYKQPP